MYMYVAYWESSCRLNTDRYVCFESQGFDLHIDNVIIRLLASFADIVLATNPHKPKMCALEVDNSVVFFLS